MRSINLILALLFAVFAFLQWNDPDGIFWIMVYGYIAVLFVLTHFNIREKWLVYLGIAVYAIGLILLIPDVIAWFQSGAPSITGEMKATSIYIEKVREFLGLLISLIAAIYLLVIYSASRSQS